MFNIHYYKFLLQLIAEFLRRTIEVAWLNSLVFPVKQLYNRFVTYRKWKLYELAHNGQVFSLENVLNDRFDAVARTIYIADGFAKERFYVFTRLENKPRYLRKYINTRGEYADTGVDFIVYVPHAVALSDVDIFELMSLVDNYKLASKRYKMYRV